MPIIMADKVAYGTILLQTYQLIKKRADYDTYKYLNFAGHSMKYAEIRLGNECRNNNIMYVSEYTPGPALHTVIAKKYQTAFSISVKPLYIYNSAPIKKGRFHF